MGRGVERFRVEVADADLLDLRDRLARTRLPDQIEGVGWEQGTDRGVLQQLIEHWRGGYDWRRAEAELNRSEHVRVVVGDQPLHALHARSPHPEATPLLLVHGWPGSVVEFLDALPGLTAHFHVVAPSLPGYGLSGPTTRPGWHPRRIAGALLDLMTALGYERFGAQGGDWGSVVTSNVADLAPERVQGLHLNFVVVPRPDDPGDLTPEEAQALAAMREWRRDEVGYQEIQGTRPQTLGYALEDSPAGLLAWIVEKFHAWSDGDDVLATFSADRILDNVTLYWLTRTATSSTRLYWEMRRAGHDALPRARIEVPTAISNYPGEITRFPRRWVERRYEVVRWKDQPGGGHFAAMEVPSIFVEDVAGFFGDLGTGTIGGG